VTRAVSLVAVFMVAREQCWAINGRVVARIRTVRGPSLANRPDRLGVGYRAFGTPFLGDDRTSGTWAVSLVAVLTVAKVR